MKILKEKIIIGLSTPKRIQSLQNKFVLIRNLGTEKHLRDFQGLLGLSNIIIPEARDIGPYSKIGGVRDIPNTASHSSIKGTA